MTSTFDCLIVIIYLKNFHLVRGKIDYIFIFITSFYNFIICKNRINYRKYFLDFINGGLNKVTDSTTILGLIDIYVDCFKVIARSMADLKNPNITFSNYTGILFYAFSHDEYLATAISDVKKKIHSVWVAAIQKSIENGEIRSDIDVDTIAYTFESVKGNFGETKADETTIKHELELFKKSHLELYKLLKK